jgi:hypothetical protein
MEQEAAHDNTHDSVERIVAMVRTCQQDEPADRHAAGRRVLRSERKAFDLAEVHTGAQPRVGGLEIRIRPDALELDANGLPSTALNFKSALAAWTLTNPPL